MRLSKMIISVLTGGMFLLTGAAQAQDTWFVDDDGGGNGCTTWVDACPDLQTALGLADSGDQIWVAAGTYRPDAGSGDRTATFQLESGVAIYGGFPTAAATAPSKPATPIRRPTAPSSAATSEHQPTPPTTATT